MVSSNQPARRVGAGIGHAPRHGADFINTPSAQHALQTLRSRRSFLQIHARQQQRKLLTTKPRRRVVVARNVLQRLRNLPNHHIADRMSILIVHWFQVIDIKHQQGARRTVTTPTFNLARQCDAESAPVGEARERVQIRVGSQSIDLLS